MVWRYNCIVLRVMASSAAHPARLAVPAKKNLPRVTARDKALAVAVVPLNASTRLAKFFSKLHWELTCVTDTDAAIQLLAVREAAVVLCDQSNWRQIVTATKSFLTPPLILVLAEQPKESEWSEVLTSGAFYLESNPLHMTKLLQLLNHAWCLWNRHL